MIHQCMSFHHTIVQQTQTTTLLPSTSTSDPVSVSDASHNQIMFISNLPMRSSLKEKESKREKQRVVRLSILAKQLFANAHQPKMLNSSLVVRRRLYTTCMCAPIPPPTKHLTYARAMRIRAECDYGTCGILDSGATSINFWACDGIELYVPRHVAMRHDVNSQEPHECIVRQRWRVHPIQKDMLR